MMRWMHLTINGRTRAAVAWLVACIALAGCVTRTPAPVVERTSPAASRQADATVPVPPPPAPLPASEAVPPPPIPAQPDWRPEFYTVKRGDTLFAIALEHGLDYRELAAMNNIENLNVIRVGQVMRVRTPSPDGSAPAGAGPSSAPLVTVPPVIEAKPVAAARVDRPNSDAYKSGPKAVKLPYSDAALAQLRSSSRGESAGANAGVAVPGSPITTAAPGATTATMPTLATTAPAAIGPMASAAPSSAATPTTPSPPAASPEGGDDQVDWGWPVKGRILSGYSETASLKGIDIAGTKGIAVVATAAGRVVYSGSGLRGYGKLVIVKHNKTYLSAYAHLDQISIREGQNVTKGQEIGKMGNSDADQTKLHFEIRSLGKPVDPMRFLPKG